MIFNRYDIDDMSSEAKCERREKAKILKNVIIFSIFLLLANQVFLFIHYMDRMTPMLALFIISIGGLWTWCIYKLWNSKFHNEVDDE